MNPCCADPNNRRITAAQTPQPQTCRVCGRRHWSMTAEPLAIGVAIPPAGAAEKGKEPPRDEEAPR